MSKPNAVGDISCFHYNILRDEKNGEIRELSTGLLQLIYWKKKDLECKCVLSTGIPGISY